MAKYQNNAVVVGSISDIAQRNGTSLAESFVSCDAVVIVDVSGSMAAKDSRGGRSRYDIALEELATLQSHLPGKIAVIAFSDSVVFVPGGQPPFMGSGTDLASALRFAKVADVPDMRFFIISDGSPDDEQAALNVAKSYSNRIDTIFVGPESYPRGREFLETLARASGGQSTTADRVQELAAKVETLLLGS
jgi:Mg-chelatase subunit ChlD